MARYLKSLQTGVVLPYSEALAKSADVAAMTAAECAEYEASMGVTPSVVVQDSAPVVEEPAPVEEVPVPVAEEPEFEEVVFESPAIKEDETPPEVDEVIAALDTELT